MKHIFVDTNVVIDLLEKRENFFIEAQELFSLADKQKVKLYISALTIANTYYILQKTLGTSNARKILTRFKLLVHVLPIDDKIIDLALVSDFADFEDAIQYYTALENHAEAIITRNKKDFKNSVLPILTAKEYLNL